MAAEHPDEQALARYFDPPYRFDFYQLVKLLEGLERRRRADTGQVLTPPGGSDDPDEEPVRFSAHADLGFHASDLRTVRPTPADGEQAQVTVNFLGLAGARGPLPLFYTELIRDRIRRGDHALQAFLDIINHRLISLWYRVRQRHRPTLHTEAPERHPYAQYLLAFAGLRPTDTQAAFDRHVNHRLEGERGLEARDLIYYAGLFWQHDRSMHGLERMLSHFFKMPVTGEQLCGRWIRLGANERTALTTGEHHNRLGVSTIAGGQVFDPQSRFALHLGPLTWQDYVDFLPTGGRFEALYKLTQFYARSAYDFDLKVQVKPAEIAPGRPALNAREGVRLGWTSWILNGPLPESREVKVSFAARLLPADDQPFHVVRYKDVPTDLDLIPPAVQEQFGQHVAGLDEADFAPQFARETALVDQLAAGELPVRVRLLVLVRADGPPSPEIIGLLRKLREVGGPRPIAVALMRRPTPYEWSLPVPAELQRWRRVLWSELGDGLLTVVGLEMPTTARRDAA